MSEERLKEIHDSIEFQMQLQQAVGYKSRYDDLLVEEIDLYNEVIDLKEKISEAINGIEITISIIKQQPSKDEGLDFYIISKLESFVKTLKGGVDNE